MPDISEQGLKNSVVIITQGACQVTGYGIGYEKAGIEINTDTTQMYTGA